MKVGQEISVPIQNFINRKFTLIKELQNVCFQANVQYWGEIEKVCLKFQKLQEVQDYERSFLQFSQDYQNSEYELNNPSNIIKVFDHFEYKNEYLVIVMEQFEQNLEQFLIEQRNQLTNQEKLNICFQITKPIQFLHQNNFIHRDIKPENYVQIGNTFKLIKFDLIKQTLFNQIMTLNVGTPIFQAPELIQSQFYTNKVDIWSLACVFYEIFNEIALFESDDPFNTCRILNYQTNQSEILSKINRINITKEFKDLLIQMINPNADSRIDANQVINQLNKILQLESQKIQAFSLIEDYNIPIYNQKELQNQQQYQMINQQKQQDQYFYNSIQDLNLNMNDLQQQIISLKTEVNSNQNLQQTTNNQIIQSLLNSFSYSLQKFYEQFNKDVDKKLDEMKAEFMKLKNYQVTQTLIYSKIEDVDQKFRQQKQQIQLQINKTENNLKEQFKNQIQISIQESQQQNKILIENNFNVIENQIKQNFEKFNYKETVIDDIKDEQMTQKLNQLINEQLKQEIYELNSKFQNLKQQFNQSIIEKTQLENQYLELQEKNNKEILLIQDDLKNVYKQMDDVKKDQDSRKNLIQNQQLQEQFYETQMMKLLHTMEENQLNPQIEKLRMAIKDEFTKELENQRNQCKFEFKSQEKNFVETNKKQLEYIDREFVLSKTRQESQENSLNQMQQTIDSLKQQYEFLKQEHNNLKSYLKKEYFPYIQQLIDYWIQQLRAEMNLNIYNCTQKWNEENNKLSNSITNQNKEEILLNQSQK